MKTYDPALMASWVQAVGSIAAIVGAIWIGERQAKRAREQAFELDRIARLRRAAAYAAVAEHGHAQLRAVKFLFASKEPVNRLAFYLTFNTQECEDALEAIRLVPLHDVGSPEAIEGFLLIKKALSAALSSVQEMEMGTKDNAAEVEFSNRMSVAIRKAEMGFVKIEKELVSAG
ncbi:hypothetical protein [Cupriavidus alkaliphilus]|uniref:hypothetical protein n=1 Tax=Cupriavidus alkaliphilus TaxID=942866 RepID=UPI001608B784|nr:hypothetical protein [Cupriavidus alkaliphilus]MBB3012041.1 hypothetical protein [Cupriavidus alkaliphilus]